MAFALALLSAGCFGLALVTGRIGLRSLDPIPGAAVSIPTAAVFFVLAAPFTVDATAYRADAALIFAVVGVFFPAVVTLITFRSNEVLGPTLTGAVSGTAPLFALIGAGLVLGERVPAEAAAAAVAIAAGVALMSWKQGDVRPGFRGVSVLWPICGAAVRGFAQAGAKAGLLLWPNPFAAALIGYLVSSATVLGASRIRRNGKPALGPGGVLWFVLTGVLNGAAVLLMYAALGLAPVSLVAPVVATYPLLTAVASRVILREEPLTGRMLAGAAVTVAAVVFLAAAPAGPG